MSQGQGRALGAAAVYGEYPGERSLMVVEQLARRGIKDGRVLAAMTEVPRHAFVPELHAALAYEDRPLPIGYGQTISQPFMVARATELAAPRPADRALEIGAGCGYQTAVLARLCAQVFAVEIVPALAERAAATLAALGIRNADVQAFDGSGGWPAHAPFDVIVVSAGAPRIPVFLLQQLAEGGRLVVPVSEGADGPGQVLTCIRRSGDDYQITEDTRCRYVDLVGRYGVGGHQPQA
jgi:protein-L-isoaspartate(D-aspartate) O-methyltransferase